VPASTGACVDRCLRRAVPASSGADGKRGRRQTVPTTDGPGRDRQRRSPRARYFALPRTKCQVPSSYGSANRSLGRRAILSQIKRSFSPKGMAGKKLTTAPLWTPQVRWPGGHKRSPPGYGRSPPCGALALCGLLRPVSSTGSKKPAWKRFGRLDAGGVTRARQASPDNQTASSSPHQLPAPPANEAPPEQERRLNGGASQTQRSTGVRSTGVRSTGVRSTGVRSTGAPQTQRPAADETRLVGGRRQRSSVSTLASPLR
jgi:hypothetical protein